MKQADLEKQEKVNTSETINIRNDKQHKNGSDSAKHAWDNCHVIDFDSAKVTDIRN